ncbi:hypothetical protein SALBM135S_04997 [Streptomyces alboniger]
MRPARHGPPAPPACPTCSPRPADGVVLRPLSLDWYEADALGSADLCHAAAGGPAALPGLLARHFAGVPLLVTEYGVQLRAHYLAAGGTDLGAPARACSPPSTAASPPRCTAGPR